MDTPTCFNCDHWRFPREPDSPWGTCTRERSKDAPMHAYEHDGSPWTNLLTLPTFSCSEWRDRQDD